MKKSVIILIVAIVAAVSIAVAGFVVFSNGGLVSTTTTTTTTGGNQQQSPQYTPMNFLKEDMTKYITLGQYTGLTVEVDKAEITDEELDLHMHIFLFREDEFTKVREGIVIERQIFNFDFTGYLLKEDGTLGEKFQGGAATNQFAYIEGNNFFTVNDSGTGSFIDGFAQGIIGKQIGDTFNIDVTFPSDYHAADMAGKKVVFEIKLNYNVQTNFTDAWVKSYTKDAQKTTEEYLEVIRKSINDGLDEGNVQYIWDIITEGSTVIEIPKQQFDYVYNSFVEEVEFYSAYSLYYFGKQLDYNQVLAEFGFKNDDELRAYANEVIKADMVRYAVVQQLGLEATDEEYRLFLDSLISTSGKTEEEILKQYTEEALREEIVFEELYEYIIKNNDLVQKPATDNE